MLNISAIKNQRFTRVSRGYSPEEVDAFMHNLIAEVDVLIKENNESEQKIIKLVEKIEQYREDEEAIKSVLLTAQKQSVKIIAQAEQDGKAIIDSATIQSRKLAISIKEEYNEEVIKLRRLKEEVSDFKTTLTELYNKQLRLIMELPDVDDDDDDLQLSTEFNMSYDLTPDEYAYNSDDVGMEAAQLGTDEQNDAEEVFTYESTPIDTGATVEASEKNNPEMPAFVQSPYNFSDVQQFSGGNSNGTVYYNSQETKYSPSDSRFGELKFGNNTNK